jgi:hypothetical protein
VYVFIFTVIFCSHPSPIKNTPTDYFVHFLCEEISNEAANVSAQAEADAGQILCAHSILLEVVDQMSGALGDRLCVHAGEAVASLLDQSRVVGGDQIVGAIFYVGCE